MLGQIASGVTALVALILSVRLTMRYGEKRRVHTLLYAVSLALTAVAAGADFVARLEGVWPPMLFRLYWFSASGLVGLMGMGTCWLLLPHLPRRGLSVAGRLVSQGIGAVLAVTVVWLLARALGMDLAGLDLAYHDEIATKAPPGVKLPFVLTSSLGALAIFGGAIYSWAVTRKAYNAWIALGALVFSSAGAAGGIFGGITVFYLGQALGSLLLYAGVVGSLQPAAAPRQAMTGT